MGIQAGLPSRLLHGGKRWYLRREAVAGATDICGNPRWEMFAERENRAVRVQLTDDPSMDYGNRQALTTLSWAPDESVTTVTVSALARRRYEGCVVEPGVSPASCTTVPRLLSSLATVGWRARTRGD